MTITSVLKLSEIEGSKRIDAEYYQPEYLEIEKKVKSHSYWVLDKISYLITDGDHGNPKYNNEGVIYVTSENVNQLGVNYENCKKISYDYSKKIGKRCYAEDNDILLTTVGKIGVATLNSKKIALSRDIARIVLSKTQNILPEFVAIYLNTIVGRKLLNRKSVGSVQKGLYLVQIKNLKIPKLNLDIQKEVKSIFLEALSKFQESKSFYSQAENILLEELGIKDFKPIYRSSYTTNLSKAFGVHRMDAEHFQPAYSEVINKIEKYSGGYTQLLSYVKSIGKYFNPKKYPGRTFSYIELADIDTSIGTIYSTSEVEGEEAPSRARRVLRKNDVIVSSVEGSLEKVAMVDEEYENSLASTGFFQFRTIKVLPEVLLVLLKSIVLQVQLKKECTGTILTAIPNKALKKILLPIIPNKIQKEVASLVKQSHKIRRRAKELLDETKIKVEEAIYKEIN